MRGRNLWIARFVLFLVSISIALLMGEWVIGRVAPQNLSIWDTTRDGMTVHRANLDVYLPRYDQRIRTNRLGMRDEETSLEKVPGTFRLLVLGDSFMEALQVPFEASLPGLLESRELAKSAPTDVLNLAVSGWGTDDQVTYLERIGMDLEPDLVLIMMTLHNDVADNSLMEFHTLEESGLVARPAVPIPLARYLNHKTKAYLAGTSQIYQLAYQTYISRAVKQGARELNRHVASLLRRDADFDLGRNWMITLALLDKAAALAESGGASLMVGLIPLRAQLNDEGFAKLIEEHGLTEEQMDREAPQRRVQHWADKRGVTIVDLLPAFKAHAAKSKDLLYLPLDGHWTANGHALAAEILAKEIVETTASGSISH